jgi:hypothetical protein
MAILNNSNAISSGGYDINNSLRFRSSASAYLNRTAGVAPTSNQKGTFSFWIKRGALSTATEQWLFAAGSNSMGCYIPTSDRLSFEYFGGSYLIATQVFRDPSAWYHIVLSIDSTQATAANRVKLYVNGVQVTSFSTEQYPTQNATFNWMSSGQVCYINQIYTGGRYFDGYETEFNYIDGQQLTPSSFGETDTTTGSWKPKAYTGTYGTNGFYLKFSDIATTSGSNAGLGKDFSGNANYWNTNNISVTAGTTYDAMTDSPTLTSATVANYPTLNPLSNTSTLTEANLTATNILLAGTTMATPSTGKWYFEYTQTTSIPSGSLWVGVSSNTNAIADNQLQGYAYASDGRKVAYNSYTSGYGATWTNGDVIGCALDLDNQTITFYKNGTSQGTAFTSITQQPYVFALSAGGAASTKGGSINCGQRPFAYTPPTGFVRLNTFNLPDSTIKKGNTVMDATLYTGTGATLNVTNAGAFKPDFVWIKDRTALKSNTLYNSSSGIEKVLFSNTTDAEVSVTGSLTAFNSNGFSVGSSVYSNVNNDNFVAWQWQAGQGSTSSNTSGSITSTVSVNATAGFSIVRYSGNATSGATVGHGLGVAPKMVIAKTLNTAGYDWPVYHSSLTSSSYVVYLNLTSAQSISTNKFNGVAPSSTVVTLGDHGTNLSGTNNQVLYCWAEIAGFSKFGSYTGNGSTDGTFVYTGFKPAFVMVKSSTSTADWLILDNKRLGYNPQNTNLAPNSSRAEDSTVVLDFLSNGFKFRISTFPNNAETFIYAAYAENPFKNALAR